MWDPYPTIGEKRNLSQLVEPKCYPVAFNMVFSDEIYVADHKYTCNECSLLNEPSAFKIHIQKKVKHFKCCTVLEKDTTVACCLMPIAYTS